MIFRRDGSVGGYGCMTGQSTHKSVFVDWQTFSNGGQKLQGMKLGLIFETDRSGHGKGERNRFAKISLKTCFFQSLHFLPVVLGVYTSVSFLKITGDIPAQFPILFQSFPVGFQIHAGFFPAVLCQQFVAEKSVLKGYFCGSILSHAAAQSARFCKHTVDAGLFEHIGTKNSCDSPTDYEHICLYVFFERIKMGKFTIFRPYRRHEITSLVS